MYVELYPILLLTVKKNIVADFRRERFVSQDRFLAHLILKILVFHKK